MRAFLVPPSRLSLGFMPQTSLSAAARPRRSRPHWLSLGFMPQTSLSEDLGTTPTCPDAFAVSGVHAPDFVERTPRYGAGRAAQARRSVSGVHAPDFVERRFWTAQLTRVILLSLGFMPQTSLSAAARPRRSRPHWLSLGFMPQTSLSDYNPGPADTSTPWSRSVSGVHAPDFVERTPRPERVAGQARHLSLGFMPQTSLSADSGQRS